MNHLHFVLRLAKGLCDVFPRAMPYKSIDSRDNLAKRIPQIRALLLAHFFSLKIFRLRLQKY